MGTWSTRGLRGSGLEDLINYTVESLREKKLAGILTEYVGERRTAVVGIGVNLRRDAALPPALRETAISLEAAGFADVRLLPGGPLTEQGRCFLCAENLPH